VLRVDCEFELRAGRALVIEPLIHQVTCLFNRREAVSKKSCVYCDCNDFFYSSLCSKGCASRLRAAMFDACVFLHGCFRACVSTRQTHIVTEFKNKQHHGPTQTCIYIYIYT